MNCVYVLFRRVAALACCATLTGVAATAIAQSPLASANFSSYADGNLVGQNGWQLFKPSTSQPIQVAGGIVSLVGGGTTSTDHQDAMLPFRQQVVAPVSGTNVITLDMLFSVAPPAAGPEGPSYFVAMNDHTFTTTTVNFQNARFAVQASGTGFTLGARVNGQAGYPYGFGSAVLNYNRDYALRARINQVAGNANDFITLSIGDDFNTLSGYGSAGYTTGGVTDPSYGAVLLSQYSSPTAYGSTVSLRSVAASVAFAPEPTWVNVSQGLFESPENWSGGFVPTASQAAVINNSGTAVFVTGGTSSLARFRVGGDGVGSLLITGGGVASATGNSGRTWIGMTQGTSDSRGEGRVIIDGSSTLYVAGSLGTQIGAGANALGAFGSLTVRQGSSFLFGVQGNQGRGGDLYVGYSSGAAGTNEGILDIDGGVVRVDHNEFNVGTGVGSGTGMGTVIIRNGGSLTVNSWAKFGGKPFAPADPAGGGYGILNISSGTFLKSGTGNLIFGDKVGTAEIHQSGGRIAVTSGELIIGGHGSDGIGIYRLTSGTLSVADSAGVGRYGGTGKLFMTGGMIVKTGRGRFEIGSGSTDPLDTGTPGNGYMEMTGGVLDIPSGDLVVSAGVGAGSTGVLMLQGGMVSSSNSVIGWNAGSVGTATISGGTLSTSNDVAVGDSGSGNLLLQGGAIANYRTRIGYRRTGEGVATVEGGEWTNRDFFYVGVFGKGRLDLKGGVIRNTYGIAGYDPEVEGSVDVSGGRWLNSDFLVVGRKGAGSLTIKGGYVENANGFLGYYAEGAGSALITGGTWANGGNLAVGLSGTGTLTMTGGLVTVGGTLSKGTYGTINLSPGGGLHIGTGGTTGVLDTDLTNNGTLVFNRSDASIFAGVVSGSGAISKRGVGNLKLTGPNALTGSTTIQQGTLQLAHAAALSASTVSVLSGGTLSLSPGLVTTIGGLKPGSGGVVDVGNGLLTVAEGLSTFNLYVSLSTGRGSGSWDGAAGIKSGSAAASGGSRTVGWLDNGDGSVTFGYAAPGDTNLDWKLDIIDIANLLGSGKVDTGLTATWAEGDFNYDGFADILDITDIVATGLFDTDSYNAATGALAAVPEPATLGLVGVAAGVALVIAATRKRVPPSANPDADTERVLVP